MLNTQRKKRDKTNGASIGATTRYLSSTIVNELWSGYVSFVGTADCYIDLDVDFYHGPARDDGGDMNEHRSGVRVAPRQWSGDTMYLAPVSSSFSQPDAISLSRIHETLIQGITWAPRESILRF